MPSIRDTYTPTTEVVAKVYSAAPILTDKNVLGGRDQARNKAAFYRWLSTQNKPLVDALEEIRDTINSQGSGSDILNRVDVILDRLGIRKA